MLEYFDSFKLFQTIIVTCFDRYYINYINTFKSRFVLLVISVDRKRQDLLILRRKLLKWCQIKVSLQVRSRQKKIEMASNFEGQKVEVLTENIVATCQYSFNYTYVVVFNNITN